MIRLKQGHTLISSQSIAAFQFFAALYQGNRILNNISNSVCRKYIRLKVIRMIFFKSSMKCNGHWWFRIDFDCHPIVKDHFVGSIDSHIDAIAMSMMNNRHMTRLPKRTKNEFEKRGRKERERERQNVLIKILIF